MKRQKTKLVLRILSGRQSRREHPLDEALTYLIGRFDAGDPQKNLVDLTPDKIVSRKHARLFFRAGNWWLEDIGSRYGTLVDGKEIQGPAGPVKLQAGAAVKTGKTFWGIFSPDVRHFSSDEADGLVVECRVVSAVNYALYHCSVPVVTGLRIRNFGPGEKKSTRISILIPHYSDPWQACFDVIPSGESIEVGKVPLALHYEKLEGLENRKKVHLKIAVDGAQIFEIPLYMLGIHEWSFDPAFRRCLACFVQPAHPVVQNIVADTLSCLEKNGLPPSFHRALRENPVEKTDIILKSFYECLKDRYAIRYCHEAPSYERDSQNLRPPHRVILDSERRMGEGTCIDLALLLASCLESVHLQPLIIFAGSDTDSRHAILGCWKYVSERFEPVLDDYQRLKKHLDGGLVILLDATGLTDRWGEKIAWEQAVKEAHSALCAEKFLFALDVAAARQTIVPLLFPLSPAVVRIVAKAEGLARRDGNGRLEVKHLMRGLLATCGKGIRNLLQAAGAKTMVDSFPTAAAKDDVIPRPTMNYRRCIEDARIIAGDNRMTFVEEEHLFYALLLSRSESIDWVFGNLGTNRGAVREAFERSFEWTGLVMQTYYEPFSVTRTDVDPQFQATDRV